MDIHGPGHCNCHSENSDLDPFGNDLLSSIHLDRVYCLNESEHRSCKNPFKIKEEKLERTRVLKSNQGDPELLLFIPFICPVKLKSINIIGGGSGTTPSQVRLFRNQDNIDFGTIENMPPVQVFDLLENPYGEIEYGTRVTRFANTNSLIMHFPQSTGEDYLEISYIGLKGESSGIRKEAVVAVWESRPMPKDHRTFEDALGQAPIR